MQKRYGLLFGFAALFFAALFTLTGCPDSGPRYAPAGTLDPGGGSNAQNWKFAVTIDSGFQSGGGINGVAYGNNTWVAVGGADGYNGNIAKATSARGVLWKQITQDVFGFLNYGRCVTYGGGKFVAGGDEGLGISLDGTTWARVAEQGCINGVAYGNGTWVIAGGGSGYSAFIWTSTNGTTWTGGTQSSIFGAGGWFGSSVYDAAYGDGKWIAVGDNGKIAASDDGETWIEVPQGVFGSNSIYDVAYGDGKWIAVGDNGTMATSDDGETWTAVTQSVFGSNSISGVAYGSGIWVAYGNHDGSGTMATSSNGVTWTEVAQGVFASNSIYDVAYGNGRWVAALSGATIAFSYSD